jgi:hypothetical protein
MGSDSTQSVRTRFSADQNPHDEGVHEAPSSRLRLSQP